jgi:4-hydroxymandelate oxidase
LNRPREGRRADETVFGTGGPRSSSGNQLVSEYAQEARQRREAAGAGEGSIRSASDLAGLEARATAVLDPDTADYVNRGSGADITRAANQAAWSRLRLRPHIGHDVSVIDTRVHVLDTELAAPVLVAPTAMQRLVHHEGERATARASARAGTVMIVSMVANCSLEEISDAAPGAPRWAQMYLLRDRDRTRALAERARDAGYAAIVASVDGAAVPYGDHGGATPSRPDLRFPNLASSDARQEVELLSMMGDFDTTVTVDDLALLANWSGLPVVVKGVLRGDDARACVDAGMSGIVVSNHGGRIVDGSVATADALPDVVAAVGGDVEIFVDGGVRSGTDVARALALGARAVLVGRPIVWGLAIGGEDGVTDVLHALQQDLRRVMAFCGAPNLDALTPDLLTASA